MRHIVLKAKEVNLTHRGVSNPDGCRLVDSGAISAVLLALELWNSPQNILF